MNNIIKIITGSALCTVLYKIMSSLSENSVEHVCKDSNYAQYMEEFRLKSDEELEKLAESKDFYKSQAAKITLMQRKITTKK